MTNTHHPAPSPQVIGFIPSRYGSTRLRAKALQDICGRPMVARVLQGAMEAKTLSRVIVLTDDRRIYDAAVSNGGEALMTPESCRNGTERIAAALEQVGCDIAVNIQGDEPLITGEFIDQAVQPLLDEPDLPVSTLACRLTDCAELDNPSFVKVVCDKRMNALYFSRSTIPYAGFHTAICNAPERPVEGWWKHYGIYVYRAEIVKLMMTIEPSFLELSERLEQLRLLENGYRIRVVEVPPRLISVDTAEDLERARAFFKAHSSQLTAYSLQLTAHSLQLTAHSSQLSVKSSK